MPEGKHFGGTTWLASSAETIETLTKKPQDLPSPHLTPDVSGPPMRAAVFLLKQRPAALSSFEGDRAGGKAGHSFRKPKGESFPYKFRWNRFANSPMESNSSPVPFKNAPARPAQDGQKPTHRTSNRSRQIPPAWGPALGRLAPEAGWPESMGQTPPPPPIHMEPDRMVFQGSVRFHVHWREGRFLQQACYNTKIIQQKSYGCGSNTIQHRLPWEMETWTKAAVFDPYPCHTR